MAMVLEQQTESKYLPPDPREVTRLLRQGELALAQGFRQRAYRVWTRLVLMDPINEAAWLALLTVLDLPEDRRVALRNILAINPNNFRAREMLDAINEELSPPVELAPPAPAASRQQLTWRQTLHIARQLLELLLIGLFIGLGLVLLISLTRSL